MRKLTLLAVVVAIAISAACTKPAGTLEAAEDTLGAATVKSIEYSGTGKWFQFGQAPNPTLPWPPFDVSSFKAAINYETPSARMRDGAQADARAAARASGPGRGSGPFKSSAARTPGTSPRQLARRPEQRPSPNAAAGGGRGTDDGNLGDAAGLPQGGAREQRDVRGRRPAAPRCRSRPAARSTSAQSTLRTEVEKVQTWMDTPVLGDTLVETTYLRLPGLRRRDVSRRTSCGPRAAIRCWTSRSRR